MGQTVTYPRATPFVRADVPRAELPPPAPHPAPETLCRPARPEEIPASAQRLLGAFRGPWEATVTYARGTTLGRLGKVVDSVVIRAHKPGVRLWAAWLDGKYHAAMVSDSEGPRRLSALQVRAYVQAVELPKDTSERQGQ